MVRDLSFNADGDLILPSERLGRLAKQAPEELRLLRLHEDLLIGSQSEPGQRAQPLLYGDLRFLHVAEIMALISSMRRDGLLSLLVPSARKTVSFIDGQVVFATSSVEDDRLGEVLWRHGLVTLEQLESAFGEVTPKKRLGAVLIERGLLTQRQLYDGIRHQVLDIVTSTFHFERGEFIFVQGAPVLRNRVRLDVDTREVIREGVRKVQELTRLDELFPDRDAVPAIRPVVVDVKLEKAEQHLQTLVDGGRSVGDLIQASHLGEYEVLKALAKLRRLGLLDVHERSEPKRIEVGGVPEALRMYAAMLVLVQQALSRAGGGALLADYMAQPAEGLQALFQQVGLDDEGGLDVEILYRNARAQGEAKAHDCAMAALKSLLDYGVFQAMDLLEDEECDALLESLDSMRADMDAVVEEN